MKGMVLIGLAVFGCGVGWAQGGVMGNWKTPSGSVVKVEGCGAEICLTVVKLEAGAPVKVDAQNPDAGLRSRGLCGLRIGSGFKADGADAASGGHLYDPKSGHTYSGKFWLKGDELHLRGFIGVSLFGRSETWTRVGEVGGCE